MSGVKIGLLFLVLFVSFAHCSTTSPTHNNSIGVLQYNVNPFTYKAGNVTEVAYIEKGGKGIVIRIQPLGTYAMFTEDLLMCDYPVEMLQGKTNPMVLTFETQAHRMIQDIGCHKLVRVEEIKLPRGMPRETKP